MYYQYRVHLFKAIAALACTAMFLALGITLCVISRLVSAAIFLFLGLVFAWVAVMNSGLVSICEEGIGLQILGKVIRFYAWENVHEVGVIGTKVFNKNNPQKTGSVFIYFSKTAMSDQDRFDMMLKWPPKDKIYFLFSMEKLANVQQFWEGPIALKNTGEIPL